MLSSKIKLERYEFVLCGDEAMNYRVDKIAATAVVGSRDFGIRFYGSTIGYEFQSLIHNIIMVSAGQTGLDPRLKVSVKIIAEKVHL